MNNTEINIIGTYQGNLQIKKIKPRTKHGIGNKDRFATIDIIQMLKDRLKKYTDTNILVSINIELSDYQIPDHKCKFNLKTIYQDLDIVIEEIKRLQKDTNQAYICEYGNHYHIGSNKHNIDYDNVVYKYKEEE